MQPLNLKTIDAYTSVVQARIALNLLASEGINGSLSNETIVLNDWLLGNAVGNIQLQVAESDVDRAIDILKSKSEVSQAELTELALAEPHEKEPSKPLIDFFYPDGSDSDSAANVTFNSSRNDDDNPTLNSREVLVEYAFRGAILSLLFFPLIPLVTWHVISIYSDSESLSPTHRRKLTWILALHIPTLVITLLILRIYFSISHY